MQKQLRFGRDDTAGKESEEMDKRMKALNDILWRIISFPGKSFGSCRNMGYLWS